MHCDARNLDLERIHDLVIEYGLRDVIGFGYNIQFLPLLYHDMAMLFYKNYKTHIQELLRTSTRVLELTFGDNDLVKFVVCGDSTIVTGGNHNAFVTKHGL